MTRQNRHQRDHHQHHHQHNRRHNQRRHCCCFCCCDVAAIVIAGVFGVVMRSQQNERARAVETLSFQQMEMCLLARAERSGAVEHHHYNLGRSPGCVAAYAHAPVPSSLFILMSHTWIYYIFARNARRDARGDYARFGGLR